jgi:hypothetical protein
MLFGLRLHIALRRVGPARIAGQRWPKRRAKALIHKRGAWSFASERSTTRAENHRLRSATGWADNSGLDFLDTFLSRKKYH